MARLVWIVVSLSAVAAVNLRAGAPHPADDAALAHASELAGRALTAEDVATLRKAPTLLKLLARAREDPEAAAAELAASPLAALARDVATPPAEKEASDAPPIVVAHGMGDSCYRSGMKSITKAAGERVGAYSVCIPTADGFVRDTIDGFLLSMDKSVDAFAERVWADENLKDGFNAFGLSQGNNVIRGYMMKYNDPPVKTFMSICGINAGVGAFPQCSPSARVIGGACQALAEVLGDLAYAKIVQDILFQADYYRDPVRLNDTNYLANSQLARWNGESSTNSTWIANWQKTNQFVWVEGTKDTEVWPREGEQWGSADPADPWHAVLPMNKTAWYETDSFGLRTADAAGKNNYESFDGNHIQFTDAELYAWLDKYFQ